MYFCTVTEVVSGWRRHVARGVVLNREGHGASGTALELRSTNLLLEWPVNINYSSRQGGIDVG